MGTNTTEPKKDKATEKSRKALKPLIEHAKKNKGTVTRVAELMSKKTGLTILRQQAETWINSDEAKRKEPRLGTGLMLLEVQTEIVYGGIPD